MSLLLRLLVGLFSCKPAPTGVIPEAPSWEPPPVEPVPPSTTTPPLEACDLVGVPSEGIERSVLAEEALFAVMTGGNGLLGTDVAVLRGSQGPGVLVVSAEGFSPYIGTYTFYYGTPLPKFPAELWLFEPPLMQGALGREDARTVLVGNTQETCFEGQALTVGDLDGDGLDDLVSAGEGPRPAPYHILEMPLPEGEHSLDELAVARYEFVATSYGAGATSIGDWNLDGINDIAFGGRGSADPYNTLGALEDNFYGAEVIPGPLIGDYTMGDVPDDGAVAWFNLFDPAYGGPGEIGLYSTLIPDITGDGAADLLVSGYLETIIAGESTDSFALFAGGSSGRLEASSALAHLHIPCMPTLIRAMTTPEVVGDLTGDGRPDVAVRGYSADIEDAETQAGAIWLLSRLHELASSPPSSPVSMTAYSDAILLGHDDAYMADVAGLDTDADGQQDLAVLTSAHLYLFRGPLLGVHDLDDADLVVVDAGSVSIGALAAGDLDGDDIPELVVGRPYVDFPMGEVRVYSGAALLDAM